MTDTDEKADAAALRDRLRIAQRRVAREQREAAAAALGFPVVTPDGATYASLSDFYAWVRGLPGWHVDARAHLVVQKVLDADGAEVSNCVSVHRERKVAQVLEVRGDVVPDTVQTDATGWTVCFLDGSTVTI